MADPIMGLVGGGLSIATDLLNQNFAREQNAITREREDTAIQRRVKDMEAAGLNPVLAAGNPAGAQALSLPHVNDPAEAAMAMMKGSQDIATSNAEKLRLEEATKQTRAATRSAVADAKMKENQASIMDSINQLFSEGRIDEGGNLVKDAGDKGNPYLEAALAQLRQRGSEATGADILNALRSAQAGNVQSSDVLKQLDISTLDSVGGQSGLTILLKIAHLLFGGKE